MNMLVYAVVYTTPFQTINVCQSFPLLSSILESFFLPPAFDSELDISISFVVSSEHFPSKKVYLSFPLWSSVLKSSVLSSTFDSELDVSEYALFLCYLQKQILSSLGSFVMRIRKFKGTQTKPKNKSRVGTGIVICLDTSYVSLQHLPGEQSIWGQGSKKICP